ncbi:MAG TPA: N,N-dimethylformamidase beta subunit family domain-containing protein, partial [Acidimicrobiales bacterium]|nr:N,N-dimethylformamidase beta subunit family domain-containing protein [Acidimicrobiales bacterium]
MPSPDREDSSRNRGEPDSPPTRAERRRAREKKRRHRFVGILAVVAAVCVIGGLAAAGSAAGWFNRSHSSKPPPAAAGANRSNQTGAGAHPQGAPQYVSASTVSQTPDGVGASWVVAENARPGTAAWRISGAQTPDGIMGYANLVQAQANQVVSLYVSTHASSFHVEAYRMGYYQGLGGRLVWTSPPVAGVVQPSCPLDTATNMVSCNWQSSLTLTVTSSWVPGQYLLKLVGSGGQQGYIPLTVWDPASHATYVLMSGVLTDQAFNAFGGYDLYQGATPCAPGVYPCSTRARVVSFDRPYAEGNGASSYLTLEYPLTRFAEMHGLDVTYWTDITLATNGNLLTNHKVLIS